MSDTGYVGTWKRGGESGASSIVSISREDGGYRFRWNKFLPDGTQIVRCSGRDPCLQYENDKPIFAYSFRAYTPEGSDDLHVECVGTALAPGMDDLQYVDRLVVQPGGLELRTYTVEILHKRVERPTAPLKFTKISDEIEY